MTAPDLCYEDFAVLVQQTRVQLDAIAPDLIALGRDLAAAPATAVFCSRNSCATTLKNTSA